MKPLLTIGVPVFNGAATLAVALESLLAQTLADFELIVSDNASTDATPAIAAEFAHRDPRVRVVRQPHNLGPVANFGYLLAQARGRYFMWCAADDRWDPRFAQANVEFLEANADYAASISRVSFGDPAADRTGLHGSYALRGDRDANLRRYVLRPDANSRYYAVHRTAVLQGAWVDDSYWALDWVVVCNVLRHGKYNEIDEVMLWRGHGGASRSPYRAIRSWRLGALRTWLPMWPFTRYALSQPALRRSPAVLLRLLWINANYARKMLVGRWRDGAAS